MTPSKQAMNYLVDRDGNVLAGSTEVHNMLRLKSASHYIVKWDGDLEQHKLVNGLTLWRVPSHVLPKSNVQRRRDLLEEQNRILREIAHSLEKIASQS